MDPSTIPNFFALVWLNIVPAAIFLALTLFVVRHFVIKPLKKTYRSVRS